MKKTALILLLLVSTAFAESKIKPGSRIVFVGDSITGLSVNYREGFNHQMKWALGQCFEQEDMPELVSLGGSGQGVATWMNVAKKSMGMETFLDVKGVDVKANLEKKADILVFMLGMNDILCPYVKPTEKDMDRWANDYMKLIDNIRGRTKPGITALASITLLTDDLNSEKKRIRSKLNQRVKALTEKHGFVYLETGKEMERLLARGRARDPKFRPTYDFVHPNTPGHTAVSVAMLEGLGAVEAAQALRKKYLETGIFDCSKKAHLSYSLSSSKPTSPVDEIAYTVTYTFTPKTGERCAANISLSTDTPGCNYDSHSNFDTDAGSHKGEFKLTIPPTRRQTNLKMTATAGNETITCQVPIPAQWLVAAGIPHQNAWRGNNFKTEGTELNCEKELIKGKGFDSALVIDGKSYPWQRYAASVNYSGFDNPDSLAWYATTYCNTFEAAYATRWIYSEKERNALLELGHDTFSSTIGLSLWMNGDALEPVLLLRRSRKRQQRNITLKKGWNHLLLRSDHSTWQWQHTCALKGVDGDSLEDIRYSIVPR